MSLRIGVVEAMRQFGNAKTLQAKIDTLPVMIAKIIESFSSRVDIKDDMKPDQMIEAIEASTLNAKIKERIIDKILDLL